MIDSLLNVMCNTPIAARRSDRRTARNTVGTEAMPTREQIRAATPIADEAGEAKSSKTPIPKHRGPVLWNSTKESAVNNTPYLYRPIAYFNGKVLKCCGIASKTSRAIVQAKADGIEKIGEDNTLLQNGLVVETANYVADRIYADTLLPYPA